MDVIVRQDAESAAGLTARLIADALAATPRLVLGLATGRTMERVYERLARMHRDDGLDFSRAVTFNLDEYLGLPPEDENSYRHYMNTHLFDHVNIAMSNTHLPLGTAADPDAECARYERLIADAGGIDLQLVGIGRSGHIGFNEPLSALRSRTRATALAPETLRQNASMFGDDADRVPRRALTMGVGTILEARRILCLVTGREKAAILARAVEGPVSAMVSASALQMHPQCTCIVDEEAAACLGEREYYDWIFQNEPAWDAFR